MFFRNAEFPDDFILDITKIPGSSDDVCLIAIKYYTEQSNNPDLSKDLRDIARAFAGNLTEYYEMSNFKSSKLREVLPHLSESARFMESKGTIDMDIESAGRIKSFYSVYQKTLEGIIECMENDEPLPTNGLLTDIYATRDILYPRHDMKFNPQAFYKLTYKTIYEYMLFIDELSKKDPRYGLVPYEEEKLRKLSRPKKYTFNKNEVHIPEKDFTDYILELEGIQKGYRYLADASEDSSFFSISADIIKLKNADLSDPRSYSESIIYKSIVEETQKDYMYKIRNDIEENLINQFDDSTLKDYYSLPMKDFMRIHKPFLSHSQYNTCNLINALDSENCSSELLNDIKSPKIKKDISDAIFNKLQTVQQLDLKDFSNSLHTAVKIRKFAKCGKDFMLNPKANGYQSFHMLVRTPSGVYEKQIRTADQDRVAERGNASHSLNYKPDVKTSFHRLKIPTPFSPKRDAAGDIIMPTELGILPFEPAVNVYYGTSFQTFSGGKTLSEFQAQFGTKEAFDKAMLDLSPKDTNFIQKLLKKLFGKHNIVYTHEQPEVDETTPLLAHIPEDIAAYPAKSNAIIYETKPSGGTSTDDTDPHDNR